MSPTVRNEHTMGRAVMNHMIGDWCRLYRADATDILDVLRAHRPDAVVTDPPYGIGLSNAGYGRRPRSKYAPRIEVEERRGDYRIHGDEAGADLSPWLDFAPQVVLWGADHLRAQLPEGGRFCAWMKVPPERDSGWDSYSDVEFAWHSQAGAARIVAWPWKGIACRAGPGDDNGLRVHPMQKPVAVMARSIEWCGLAPGSLVLDPYLGSGTTAIAAYMTRTRFVGVEIEERWYQAAIDRIERHCNTPPLFRALEEGS